jgi:putative zinc finger/helix-turn-helix YgiT family protein
MGAKGSKCVQCRGGRLVKAEAPETVRVGDVEVRFAAVPVLRCEACGETYYDGPTMERVELHAAAELARAGVRSPEALRFMRKTIGMSGKDLAKLLGTTPETVSRWENGKAPIDRYAMVVVGALVEDALAGRQTTRELLEAGNKPSDRRRIVAQIPADLG